MDMTRAESVPPVDPSQVRLTIKLPPSTSTGAVSAASPSQTGSSVVQDCFKQVRIDPLLLVDGTAHSRSRSPPNLAQTSQVLPPTLTANLITDGGLIYPPGPTSLPSQLTNVSVSNPFSFLDANRLSFSRSHYFRRRC